MIGSRTHGSRRRDPLLRDTARAALLATLVGLAAAAGLSARAAEPVVPAEPVVAAVEMAAAEDDAARPAAQAHWVLEELADRSWELTATPEGR